MVMTRFKAFIGGTVAALAFIATAHAADPPGSWIPPADFERPQPRSVELMSGWYLRGDVGYRMNRMGSVDAPSTITSQDIGKAFGFTLGAGYKYQWFRADLTFDHGSPANATGTTASGAAQPQYTGKIDAFSALANVYFDLGTWSGFTPYVGVGAGGTYLRNSNYHDTTLPSNQLVSMSTSWNTSWAAMAGVSIQIAPIWVIDVGYRYLSLGDVKSGTGTNNSPITWKSLSTQEVRVGFRYLFD